VSCPKIYEHYTKDSKFYIEMEYIPGKTLCDIWPELSEEQKQIVTDNILNELNKLKKETSNEICGIDGNNFRDPLFGHLKFESERAFNKYISSKIRNKRISRIFLSHGELSSRNIIVKEDLSVVFVNWHCMGFLPEYWDLMKTFYYNPLN
ncbi:uncharacterized protein ASCRUDRAFT_24845, partial [Ascoidea rubescens DSM 1968]